MLTLIIGGARSGKSRFAQSLCCSSPRVAYVATARVEDEEMRGRVARHRQDRPPNWITFEEPLAISEIIRQHALKFDFMIVDCLTLWLGNLCWSMRENSFQALEWRALDEVEHLVETARSTRLVVVTNEVGQGIVPESPLGRLFRDLQGWINQAVAGKADLVYQMVAGIPIPIKSQKGGNATQHGSGSYRRFARAMWDHLERFR